MDAITELVKFVAPSTRKDIKLAATQTVTQLTGSKDGLNNIITKETELVTALLELMTEEDVSILQNIFKAIINLSAEEEGSKLILDLNNDIVKKITEDICSPDNECADFACAILANLSNPITCCSRVLQMIEESPRKFEGLVKVFCKTNYNIKGASLDLIGSVIANCTQIKEGRKLLLQQENNLLEQILPFISYPLSTARRKSIVSAVHNCCFEKDYHEWMLDEDIELATLLVMPLAGPDTFSVEENESLPLDLQYLPEDKTREKDPEIRYLLLESLMKLCTTRNARGILRNLNIYLILREHHKWETNEKCIELNEDVVNFLIRTEEEIGHHEDLSKIEVPPDLIEKFSEPPSEDLQSSMHMSAY